MFIAASALALAAAVLAYRRSMRRGGDWWLLGLRLAVLLGLVALLAGAVLGAHWTVRSRRVVVLVDRSASIAAVGADSALLALAAGLELPAGARRELWAFSDSVRANVRPGEASGSATELGLALAAAGRSRPGAIVLLSDGRDNGRDDPIVAAREAGVPVHAIGFGARRARNVGIERVVAPPVVHAGESVSVSVRVSVSGGAAEEVGLRLGSETRRLRLPAGDASLDQEFRVVMSRPGPASLVAAVDSLSEESDYSDNVLAQDVEVRASRHSIVYLAGAPGPTSRFVVAALRGDDRLTVTVLSPASTDTSALRRADVLVLDDVAESRCSPAMVAVMERRSESGLGVLVLAGPAMRFEQGFGRLFGLTSGPAVAGPFVARPTRAGRLVAWLDGFGRLDRRPAPLDAVARFLPTTPTWETWLEAEGSGEPLLVRGGAGRVRTLGLAGYPAWRWGFGSDSTPSRGLLDEFLVGAVRYLAEPDRGPLRLNPVKPTYYSGERVTLRLAAQGPGGVPWSGLSVSLRLHPSDSGSASASAPMSELAPGVYEANVAGMTGGRYRAVATAVLDDSGVGEASAELAVLDRSVEMVRLGLNEPLLLALARESEGAYVPAESVGIGGVPVRLALRRTGFEFDLRRSAAFYALLALVAGAEWLVRRRRGLL